MQGEQGMLRFALQNEHAKQRHDIVTQHGKGEGSFDSAKIIELETAETQNRTFDQVSASAQLL